MYLLIFILIIGVAYVSSFKEDFTQEQVGKVAMALAIIVLLIIILGILGSLVKR